MVKNLTYKQFGAKAILIKWEPVIDDEILKDILLFKEKILTKDSIEFVDLIQGYHSLTITYKNYISNFENEVFILKSIYNSNLKERKQTYFQWEIPVCYDVEFGIDLKEISQHSNIEINQIIKLHSEGVYKIYFIGFLPGFLYLGGLNEQLFFDRKRNPRLNVAKGSVGIGGKQTGVYPNDSAGGWNIIGKTPVNFFDLKNDNPCFAKAGDLIKFKPISLNEFQQLEKDVALNPYQISKTLQDA